MLIPSLCLALLSTLPFPSSLHAARPDERPVVKTLTNPAAEGSRLPNLALGADGELYLSWVESEDDGVVRLRFSRLTDEGWTAPRTIARGDDWFVNWADFPSVAALPDGTLAAHWLGRLGHGTYAYGVRMRISRDRGRTWGDVFTPHSDRSATEHGFVSLVPLDDHFRVVWLDGRAMAQGHDHDGTLPPNGDDEIGLDGLGEHQGTMAIRTALVARDGSITDEIVLDPKTCECCQTAAVRAGENVVIAYRDRSDTEVRDVAISGVTTGGITMVPHLVHADGWNQDGCPVNGPALAARERAPVEAADDAAAAKEPGEAAEGKNGGEAAIRPASALAAHEVAVAWYTEAEGRARVLWSHSDDLGVRFREPVTLDDGNPIGRVDLAPHPEGGWIVCWIERGDAGGEIRLRRIDDDGTLHPSLLVARTSTERSAGFPRIEARGSRVVIAWTETRSVEGAAAYPVGIRTAELEYPGE